MPRTSRPASSAETTSRWAGRKPRWPKCSGISGGEWRNRVDRLPPPQVTKLLPPRVTTVTHGRLVWERRGALAPHCMRQNGEDTMGTRIVNLVTDLCRDEEGASLVEYI